MFPSLLAGQLQDRRVAGLILRLPRSENEIKNRERPMDLVVAEKSGDNEWTTGDAGVRSAMGAIMGYTRTGIVSAVVVMIFE